MRFFFRSQVSYFEIYLDKIRDLLDGKHLLCLNAASHLTNLLCCDVKENEPLKAFETFGKLICWEDDGRGLLAVNTMTL